MAAASFPGHMSALYSNKKHQRVLAMGAPILNLASMQPYLKSFLTSLTLEAEELAGLYMYM